MAELSHRYFLSRGPATSKDFTWWSGLSPSDAKRGVDMIRSQLDQGDINKETYFFSSANSMESHKNPAVYLLPAWDEYTVAYKDRSVVLEASHETKAGHGIFNPNIIIDGMIRGSWRRTLTSGKIVLMADYFSPVSTAVHQRVEREARRHAKFLASTLEFKSNHPITFS